MQMFFMCNNIMGCADMYISEIQYTENRARVMAPPSNGVFMGISTDEVVPVRVLLTGVKAEASMLIVSKCMAHDSASRTWQDPVMLLPPCPHGSRFAL